ncbi:hypothetical protein VPH35_032764 [Triticum aestivum]
MVLNYTSGTTAAPKGVVHCHRGIFLVTMVSLVDWEVQPRPTFLWTLPLFHANGWSFPWGMAAVGGTNIFLRRVDAAGVYSAIANRRVTHLRGAPVVLSMLANMPENVRWPLPGKPWVRAYGDWRACCVLRVEGRVEQAAGVGARAAQGEARRAHPGMAEVAILDSETGHNVPWDDTTMGEIVLRGGCVMLGYLNDTAKAAIRDDGWFYTGDVGVMHPDGYLEIRDRSKDVISSGGENISSIEVESMLYSHPAVSEAAVVAWPDEFWRETPCAFVSPKDGAAGVVTAAEVVVWSRERMAGYMAPKTVVFCGELPKTSTGKVQKYVLRNLTRKMGPTRRGSSISSKM